MSREELEQKMCKELREIAKEKNISGRWEMTKSQLIDAILGAEVVRKPKETVSAKEENKVDNQDERKEDVEVEEKSEKESANRDSHEVKINVEQKMQYVEGVAIGALVAFRLSSGKVKSAKVIRKSTKNRKLKLETDYGALYVVPYEDIIWVRTGKRWPKGVYRLLKGLVGLDEENK